MINKLGTFKSVIFFFLLFVLSLTLINGDFIGVEKLKGITGGIGILDLESHYTPEQAYNIFELQGETGREFYKNLIIYQDILFPVIYTLFWISLISFFYRLWIKNKKLLAIISMIPLLGGLCDLLENASILYMLSKYPEKLFKVATVSNYFTVIKNIVLMISVALSVLGIVTFIVKRARGNINSAI